MNEVIKTLAQHLNLSEETVRKALGAVMVFLKGHLPEGLAAQLQAAVPETNTLATSFEATKEPAAAGGLLGMVTGMAGKLLGGQVGSASELTGLLGQAGLNMDQITKFLPKAAELLKDHVPAEVYDKIAALVPGMAANPAKV